MADLVRSSLALKKEKMYTTPRTRAKRMVSPAVEQASTRCARIHVVMRRTWAAQTGPTQRGKAVAKRLRASTRAEMDEKCQRNCSTLPPQRMFFLSGYVYLGLEECAKSLC